MPQSRRQFLKTISALGCSLAAAPLVTPLSFAAVPSDHRLVVIILRGGMDGMDALRPVGDPMLRQWRPDFDMKGFDLGGFHRLHPAMKSLYPLWQNGELGFAQAVATPYRNKRSHFDGQDILEGGGQEGGAASGWLNRAIGQIPGATAQTAYAIGRENMLLASGDMAVSNWTPEIDLQMSPQSLAMMQRILRDDPTMAAAFAQAAILADQDGDPVAAPSDTMMVPEMGAEISGKAHIRLAEFAAQRLREESRIACFSLSGWDTHARQHKTLKYPLLRLSEAILAMRTSLAANWGKTLVLAMTEFGRTVHQNGSFGTDHGTGGTMIMAGGALRGAQVFGTWPGLAEADLFDRRDLMPTRDVRAYVAWALHGLFGIPPSYLSATVFPGLDMGDDPRLLR